MLLWSRVWRRPRLGGRFARERSAFFGRGSFGGRCGNMFGSTWRGWLTQRTADALDQCLQMQVRLCALDLPAQGVGRRSRWRLWL